MHLIYFFKNRERIYVGKLKTRAILPASILTFIFSCKHSWRCQGTIIFSKLYLRTQKYIFIYTFQSIHVGWKIALFEKFALSIYLIWLLSTIIYKYMWCKKHHIFFVDTLLLPLSFPLFWCDVCSFVCCFVFVFVFKRIFFLSFLLIRPCHYFFFSQVSYFLQIFEGIYYSDFFHCKKALCVLISHLNLWSHRD